MSIREGTDKRVSFDTRDKLGDKIDKLTVVMSELAVTDNHGPLSHKYIKVGDRKGLMVKGDISLDPMIETGAMVETAIQDRIIRVVDLEEISEEIVDRVVEKVTEMKGMGTTTIEIGTDQGRENLQETIEGIEGLAMTGLDQGPELVQIGIG